MAIADERVVLDAAGGGRFRHSPEETIRIAASPPAAARRAPHETVRAHPAPRADLGDKSTDSRESCFHVLSCAFLTLDLCFYHPPPLLLSPSVPHLGLERNLRPGAATGASLLCTEPSSRQASAKRAV